MNSSNHTLKKNYQKIPKQKHKDLIKLVFLHQWQIIKAARSLQINYASAKNIITRYRRTMIMRTPTKIKNAKRCHYKKLVNQISQIQVKSTFGGFYRE